MITTVLNSEYSGFTIFTNFHGCARPQNQMDNEMQFRLIILALKGRTQKIYSMSVPTTHKSTKFDAL